MSCIYLLFWYTLTRENRALVLAGGEMGAFDEGVIGFCFCLELNEEKGDRYEEKDSIPGREEAGVGTGR